MLKLKLWIESMADSKARPRAEKCCETTIGWSVSLVFCELSPEGKRQWRKGNMGGADPCRPPMFDNGTTFISE